MPHLGTILSTGLAVYGIASALFLISENRRPQTTLAWMLAFVFAPVIGVLLYFLFGRDQKAFSKERELLRQDLKQNAQPMLSPLLSRQDAEIARLDGDGASHAKLMMLVRRNSDSALTCRNRVDIEQDAATFYPHLITDMQAARHSIHHQYFIWAEDAFTQELNDILIRKATAGVEVRLLYDPIGSRVGLSRTQIDAMRTAGVSISETSPLYRLHTISYRNHRKITVIDGVIGYTGGMNIGQEHLDGGKGFDSWRDTQLRVVGEAASVLQAVFMVDWYNAVREDLFSAPYFPAPPAGTADVPVQILTSGPDSQWGAIRQLYATMIVSAQHHVRLQSPFFIPDATLADALAVAALSGVDVKVMVSARPSGNRLPDWAGLTYLADIARAGVRVFQYEKGYLHAKTISIDGETCSIGSANVDIRSFSLNYELNAVIYSPEYARQLEADFDRDLAYCTEFDPAAYRRRGVVRRFRDSTARLLSPLL